MDFNKIGEFIANERKLKKLTQVKLAEMLYVSEKTVSKWENGNGVPDTNSLTKLCEILDVSVNELLNGERIPNENYISVAEERLLELEKYKEVSDKRLLKMEIVIGVLSLIVVLICAFVVSVVEMETWLGVCLTVFGLIVTIVGACFALRIEQVAGFYRCEKCGYKYVPTYKQVLFAAHLN